MSNVYIRTIIIYFSLIASVRIMGKRQIGELQVSEFIITVMLSEIAAAPITDTSIPLRHALIPMLILLTIELIISYLLMKSNFLRRLFHGEPTLLIRKGELIQSNMRRNRIELEELLTELRQKGFSSISEVRYAILEDNGKLSVIPNASDRPATPCDLGMQPSDPGIAHPLIVDGYILKENFPLANWSENKLRTYLTKKKLSAEDVFLLTVDDCGKVCLIRRQSREQ